MHSILCVCYHRSLLAASNKLCLCKAIENNDIEKKCFREQLKLKNFCLCCKINLRFPSLSSSLAHTKRSMRWNEMVLLSTQSRLVFVGHISSSDSARQLFCGSTQILQACQCLAEIISPFLFYLTRETEKFSLKRRHGKTQFTAAPRVWHSESGTKGSLYHRMTSWSVPGSL